MQLTLTPQPVFTRLDDPNFTQARLWTGRTADGTRVKVLIACVSSCDETGEPDLQAALPPAQLVLDSAEAAHLIERMIA